MRLAVLCLWALLVSGHPAGGEVVVRLGTCGRPNGHFQQLAQRLQDWLRGPGLRLALAPPSEDLEQLRLLCSGDVQLSLVRSSSLANYYRPWGLLSLPYLLEQPELWVRGLEGQRLLSEVGDHPFRALACWPLGPRCLASRRPLTAWHDLTNRQVLLPQSRFCWDSYTHLGAEAVLAPLERSAEFPELEAVEACLLDLDEFELLKTFPHLWDPGHAQEWLVLVVQERAFRRLSAEHRLRLQAVRSQAEAVQRWLDERRSRVAVSPTPLAQRSEARQLFTPVRQRNLRLVGPGWLP